MANVPINTALLEGGRCHSHEELEVREIEFVINLQGRKLKEDELAKGGSDFEVLTTGTESVGEKATNMATRCIRAGAHNRST